jgi:hypothetical protein
MKKPIKNSKNNNTGEVYEIHEIANILPMMNAIEFEAFKKDIAKNGLREPIYLFDNKIIDGRNRYKACLETNTKPIFKNYTGDVNGLRDFVISLNINRRHLTTSQLSCLAVENIEYYENITKQNLSLKMKNIRIGKADNNTKTLNTMQTLSSLFGVSERYIADAKKLYKLDVELFNKVRTGTITLSKAFKDYAILQKLDTINKDVKTNIDVELTRADIKKINELVKELHITETKAKDYIIKKKLEKLSNIRTNPKNNNKIEYKEIKFRISENDKAKLQTIAKDKKTTVAELLRDILSKKLK